MTQNNIWVHVMHQHKSILTTNNLGLKYIRNQVNIYYIILIYILAICTRNLNVYYHFTACLRKILKHRPVTSTLIQFSLQAHSCCLDFYFHSVNTIYSLKKYNTRPDFTNFMMTLCTFRHNKVSYRVTSTADPSRRNDVSVHKPMSQITFIILS